MCLEISKSCVLKCKLRVLFKSKSSFFMCFNMFVEFRGDIRTHNREKLGKPYRFKFGSLPLVLICLKGAGQHIEGQGLPSTFTNQTVCQPMGTDVFGEDILLLVDKTGLVCKYAVQALTFDIWPAPFRNTLL